MVGTYNDPTTSSLHHEGLMGERGWLGRSSDRARRGRVSPSTSGQVR